jgi:FAD/FMN-containing dehydrogenase
MTMPFDVIWSLSFCQLDMGAWNCIRWEPGEELITAGPGVQLGILDAAMGAKNSFLPHGECSSVCVGGHAQSGGFSVDCPRSFGFFIDHLYQFDLVMAPTKATGGVPKFRTVRRPTLTPGGPGSDPENDELWFAMVGGSPGNFGVITR